MRIETCLSDGECLHLSGVANVRTGAEIDERPTPVHSGGGSGDALADDAALELVVLHMNKTLKMQIIEISN